MLFYGEIILKVRMAVEREQDGRELNYNVNFARAEQLNFLCCHYDSRLEVQL